ncbi:flagellin N-terminal helical domain-containing protein [Nitrospira sp. Kam-Ns4a]
MALTVNTNLASVNAQRNVGISNDQLSKSLERLSSGLRINRAGDDAAGLSIANKLQAQVRGLQQAARNVNNAISLVQTAEGALNTTTNILQRLRELAVQAASDDNAAADRATLNAEAQQLIAELTRAANTSEFNGVSLLDGSFTGKFFQIGSNSGQNITFDIGDTRAKALGTRATLTSYLQDGAFNGQSANIAAGQVRINSTNIVTDSNDDTVSVLEFRGNIASAAASMETTASAFIVVGNGATTATILIGNYNSSTAASSGSMVTGIINTINTNLTAASVVGIKLRGAGSAASAYVVFTATGGRDVTLFGTSGTTANNLGLMFGTEIATSASGFMGTSAAASVTTYNGQSSAIAKAAAINAVKNTTDVTAKVDTTTLTGSSAITAATLVAGDFYINGVDIGAVTVQANDGNGALVSAINAKSSETGVTASLDGSSRLVLSAKDGRNITVDGTAAAMTAALGITVSNTNNITRGTVTLNSKNSFTLGGTAPSRLGTDSGGTGLTSQTVSTSAANRLSSLDISTQSGAENAILSLDSALAQVDSTRAKIGAVQNRIQLTVESLNVAAENLSASESRIRDADFALETAKFTRAQILVQAGTAILAQANATPQVALQLLR